jgi:hypothetical protein
LAPRLLSRAVYPAQHRAVASVQEEYPPAVSSVQASSLARPQAEAWSAVRCAVARQPEEYRGEARHVRNARAHLRAECRWVASLSGRQLGEPGEPGVQVLPLEAACESARQPAASVLSALRVREVAEAEAVGPLALRPAGAAHVEAAVAVVPHAAVARAAAPHVAAAREAEAGQVAARRAVALPAVPEPRAAVPSSASRLRSAPARRSTVRMRFARAPRRLRTATPTARSWPAARGEVWSW